VLEKGVGKAGAQRLHEPGSWPRAVLREPFGGGRADPRRANATRSVARPRGGRAGTKLRRTTASSAPIAPPCTNKGLISLSPLSVHSRAQQLSPASP